MTRTYPDEPAEEFPQPPRTITDRKDRPIDVIPADDADTESLVEMYLDFDPADRAQGIPPVKEEAIREWLETILDGDCVNVVAKHDDTVAGHATLVPDNEDEHELAIFVLQAYQALVSGRRWSRRCWVTVRPRASTTSGSPSSGGTTRRYRCTRRSASRSVAPRASR